MLDLKKTRRLAISAVTAAGNFLKDFQEDVLVEQKKDVVDIQTNADLKAEKIVIDLIQKTFPKHNILSEEIGLIDNKSDYTWVIDPLDGTKEYFRQLTTYSSLISLESKTELLTGACYVPASQEIYSASKDLGSFYNNQKNKVSNTKKLEKAFILNHPPTQKVPPQLFKSIWETLGKLIHSTYRLRSTWFDTWFTCQMATGGFDGYMVLHEHGPKWYDIASGIIIAKEAGAKITDRFGKPLKIGDLSNGLVITNGHIHDQLLNIINS